jgi:hypothetical protein
MSSVNHIIIKYNRSNIKKGSRSLASKCPQIISVLIAPERDVTHIHPKLMVMTSISPIMFEIAFHSSHYYVINAYLIDNFMNASSLGFIDTKVFNLHCYLNIYFA